MLLASLPLHAFIATFLTWFVAAPPPTVGAVASDTGDTISVSGALDIAGDPSDEADDAETADDGDEPGANDRPPNRGPVAVKFWSENLREGATVKIGRNGAVSAKTMKVIKRLFRCKRTNRQRRVDQGVLAFIAEVGAKWPGHTIEVVSAYRGMKREKRTSHHLGGRAVDFRIKGVKLAKVRDYMWRHFRDVGVGYYPESGFVHVDHRKGDNDIAWTERDGKMRYHPGWAEKIRSAREAASDKYKAKVEALKKKKRERKNRAGV